jgi:hypothetical protein
VEVGVGFSMMGGNGSCGVGLGAGLVVDFVRWEPIALRMGVNPIWLETKRDVLPQVDAVMVSGGLSVLARLSKRMIQPYVGAGICGIKLTQPTDELADKYFTGYYDPGLPASTITYNLGSGIGPCLHVGTFVRVGQKIKLMLDLNYLPIRPELELTYTVIPSGRQYTRRVSYDFESAIITLGVCFGLTETE